MEDRTKESEKILRDFKRQPFDFGIKECELMGNITFCEQNEAFVFEFNTFGHAAQVGSVCVRACCVCVYMC